MDQAAAAQAARPVSAAGPMQFGTNAAGMPIVPPGPPPTLATPLAGTTPAAPAQPAPGAAQMQPEAQDPRDAALGALVSPRAAAPGHSVGLSPADKGYLEQLRAQGDQVQRTTREGIELNKNAVDAFQQQSDTLSTESQVAHLSAQKDLEQNAAHRKQLATETAERSGKIQDELARLGAQGVDPNHWWNSRSTGEKIGAAVAIGLGAFAAYGLGPRGQEHQNTALGIINNAISNDIEAQKTNLLKSVDVAKMKMGANAQSFDQQSALLSAERDSVQTAYSVAMNDVTKRAAMYKDNADYQANAQKLTAGLQSSMDERVGAVNERIYNLRKRAEQVVGGGESGPAKQIVARTMELRNIAAAGGKDLPVAEARRLAANEIIGVDVKPGAPEGSIAKVDKAAGGGPLSPRLVAKVSDLNAGEQDALALQDMLRSSSSFLSREARAKAAAYATHLRALGHTSIPEQPLSVLPGAMHAAIGEVLKDIRLKRQSLQSGGVGGSSAEELGGERDE